MTAFANAAAVAEAEQSIAVRLLRDLLAKPQRQRVTLIERSEEHRSFPLAAALLTRSHEIAPRDPHEAESLARLALRIADRLDSDPAAETLVSELRARAWALVGDARRRRGEIQEAEVAFERAGTFLSRSSDLLERAGFCSLLATLRQEQGRVEECQALRDRAAALSTAVTERGEER